LGGAIKSREHPSRERGEAHRGRFFTLTIISGLGRLGGKVDLGDLEGKWTSPENT